MEDCDELRTACRLVLERAGWRVDEARDGDQALAQVEGLTGAGHYDFILSDVQMPRTGGLALYRMLARDHPGATEQFVFMSSDVVDDEPARLLKHGGVPFMAKPFTSRALLAMAERMSERNSPR